MNGPAEAGEHLLNFFDKAVELDEASARAEHHTLRLPLTRFAAAQLRMRIVPALGRPAGGPEDNATSSPPPEWIDGPIHIALFGGTNTGKSTLVNLLLGRAAAGMDVRARYSQHPEAYLPPEPTEAFDVAESPDAWINGAGTPFGRYRLRRNERSPRYTDVELAEGQYQPAITLIDHAAQSGEPLAPPVAGQAVLWDLPDFSTEESRAYLPSVLDVIAMADLVLMTVTSESYADDRTVALLGMVREAGARLCVVSNKTAPHQDLIDDIRAKAGATAPGAPVYFLPHVAGNSPEERLRTLLATPEADELRCFIAEETGDEKRLKRQSLAGSIAFLDEHLETILAPLEREARLAQDWRIFAAETTERQLLRRYLRQYLDNEKYGEYRETLLRVMAQLGIPGISVLVRGIGDLARVPLRLVRGWLFGGGTDKEPLEHKVLQELFNEWLGTLKEQAQRQAQATRHPDWQMVAARLDSDSYVNTLRESFATGYETYRADLREEIERRSKEILESLSKKPKLVTALKGFRLSTDLLTTAMAVSSHGLDPSDMILAPVVASITDWMWELLGQYYVEDQKRRLKLHQFDRLTRLVEERLMGPAIALFPTAVTGEDIARVRHEFALAREAAGILTEASE